MLKANIHIKPAERLYFNIPDDTEFWESTYR